jgi:HSP20 family protein
MSKKTHDEVAIHRQPLPPAAPADLFGRLRGEIDRLFDDLSWPGFGRSMQRASMPEAMRAWMPVWPAMPAADFVEKDGHFELSFELAGLKPEDIDLRLDDTSLSLRAEKEASKDRVEGDVHLCERSYGTIQRRLGLPDGIDHAKVTARFENGVLLVTLPKSDASRAAERKIDVAAA